MAQPRRRDPEPERSRWALARAQRGTSVHVIVPARQIWTDHGDTSIDRLRHAVCVDIDAVPVEGCHEAFALPPVVEVDDQDAALVKGPRYRSGQAVDALRAVG